MTQRARDRSMQLPLNFHRSFIPERRLIAALLAFAADGKSGTQAEIAAETGIPMGKFTGKVPAILGYARGMGLVRLDGGSNSSQKKPILTGFGRIVYEEDRLLGEPLTQWLAHLHMCLPDTGAIAWHKVFNEGRGSLGNSFSTEQLENYLVGLFGPGRKRTGPLLRCYLDDSALARTAVLRIEGGLIKRGKAPLLDEYAHGYAAFILSTWQRLFAHQFQLTTDDFNEKTGVLETCMWDESELEKVLALVERTGLISVDRQMRPWIIERKADASQAWEKIYSNFA